MLLSTYLVENNVGFGISCTRKVTTAEAIGDVLYTDRHALVGDLAECIRNVWKICHRESIVTLNSGAIVNMAQQGIEFAITAGGSPFPGAKDAITALHRMGVPTFIASGDRSAKLERMADHLGIPRDRVYGVATPAVKAQIVADLKAEYDRVVMVGDGINDLCAMRNADIAILTIQQPGDRPEDLYKEADHVVKNVGEVVTIVQDLIAGRKNCDRDSCGTTHKR
jgi:Cu+-exporting ATPase